MTDWDWVSLFASKKEKKNGKPVGVPRWTVGCYQQRPFPVKKFSFVRSNIPGGISSAVLSGDTCFLPI